MKHFSESEKLVKGDMKPSRQTLISLWNKLIKIRKVEEKIIEIYPEKEIRCPVHLSIGQEGVAAGVGQALKKEDQVFSNHRCHAHYLSKGGSIEKMLAEIYGKKTGCAGGRGGSMHLIDESVGFMGSTPIVGNTIPISVGAALSAKMQNKDNVVVLFLGDGAIEEGVFHESINFASLKNLPILFVCENNFYSVFTNISLRQPKRDIYHLAKGHGVKSYKLDGSNALEVYNLTKEAIERIRAGEGPIFLEFLTYRWRTHCGINYDDDLDYRDKKEAEEWKKKDPLEILKNIALSCPSISESDLKSEEAIVNQEIERAVKFAKSSPFPEKESISERVYSE